MANKTEYFPVSVAKHKDWLKWASDVTGRSVTDLVNQAVSEMIPRLDPELRKTEEAMKAGHTSTETDDTVSIKDLIDLVKQQGEEIKKLKDQKTTTKQEVKPKKTEKIKKFDLNAYTPKEKSEAGVYQGKRQPKVKTEAK